MVKHEDARVERRDLIDETEPVDDEARVEAVQVGGELVRVRLGLGLGLGLGIGFR